MNWDTTPPKFSLPVGHKLEDEYRRPYALYSADPTPAAGDGLLKALKPVVDGGLKSFGGKNVNPMLRSHAKRLTLDAMRTYDPAKGPLRAHVTNSLQGLKRYGIRQQQVISVPDAVATDHKNIADAERDLEDELGRAPSDGELADRVGLRPGRIGRVRKYRPGFASSQAQSRGTDGPEDPGVASTVDRTAKRLEFLHPDLDPVNQAIVEFHLGLNGRPKLTFTQTARRLNLTSGAISQRAASIQKMVDELEDAGI